jgi:predicted alpha-1,6-mannanase (GH76 family)
MILRTLTAACVFLFTTGFSAQINTSADPAPATPSQRVTFGVAALMRYYDHDTGLWNTEGWWNAANSVTVLASVAAAQRSAVPAELFRNTYTKAQKKLKLFRNDFYDDEGWWALAWIQAYDATHHRAYLSMAESIFNDMTGGWDNTCAGGIWWKKDRHYKNAIANELFFAVAGQLARRTNGAKSRMYRSWALREWQWFRHTGMINQDGLINDGLTPACENNHSTTWTYNQGVVLGGLVDLAALTHNPELLTQAQSIADAALHHLTDADSILHDPTEPHCSGDTVQFKGILMRNLLRLHRASPDARYSAFFRANANSIWNRARTRDDQFSCAWSGPAEPRSAGALTSALDALVADWAAHAD